jgi:hypothetical protein
MYHRISKLMIGLLSAILISTLWIAPAYAQEGPGQWMTVENSEPYWFSFRVGTIDNDRSQSYVSIGLHAKPTGGADFQVFAGGDWSMWDNYDEGGWIGEGHAVDNDPRTWSGELVPGTYFIRMDPNGAREVRLAVNGEGVHRFKSLDHSPVADFIVDVQQPEVAAAAQTVVEQLPQSPTAVASTFTVAEPQRLAVGEPEMEMVPGRWMEVDVNEPMWFTFSVGQVEDQQTSHVSISLFTEPGDGAEFQVFDSASANSWVTPAEGDWFGAGTSSDNGPFSWSGNLVPGAYSIRVDPQGVNTCLLAISGEAVQY